MMSLKPSLIMSVLAFAMVTACSDNKDVVSDSPALNEAASYKSQNDSDVKSDEAHSESKNTVASHKTSVSRSAESHTHGDAELAIVLEDGAVTIEFDSPLYNVLGFEHAPKTDAQNATLDRAKTVLGDGDALFTFNPEAECQAINDIQDISFFHTDKHDDHEGHDDEHDDEHEDDHDDHDDHDEVTHRDVLLTYNYTCQNPDSLSEISVNLFELFTGLSEVDVTYLGPSVQKQVRLTASQSRVDITQ